MIKKILQFLLITTTLFSYEIRLDKPKKIEKKFSKPSAKIVFIRDDSKELVIDKTNGLMWQDDLASKSVRKNRQDAKQYCRRLVFAGYDDWYLPRVHELKLIIDHQKHNPAINSVFKNVVSKHYWTSSPNLSDIITAINIDFKSGESYKNTRKGKCYVRCVRGKYNIL